MQDEEEPTLPRQAYSIQEGPEEENELINPSEQSLPSFSKLIGSTPEDKELLKNKKIEYWVILGFTLLWYVFVSSVSSVIQYWVPDIIVYKINISSFILNVLGTAIIAVSKTFQKVKFQYLQAYLLYDAINNSFCSAFTTFGNLIEDTGKFMMEGAWVITVVNLFGTLAASFVAYQVGRWLAMHWKSASKYSDEVAKLDNPDTRMAYEVENAVLEREKNYPASVYFRGNPTKLQEFLDHVKLQQDKSKRHTSLWPQKRHIVILFILGILPIANFVIIRIFNVPNFRGLGNNVINSLDYKLFDCGITTFWSIAGVLTGKAMARGMHSKKTVQWTTFRVNMMSCILIGIAHNILLFRNYLPFSNGYFNLAVQRFVTQFCGSASSYAGLIDETMQLYNAKIPKKYALRNIFYNLFICLLMFFVVVLFVRFAVFF